MNPVDVVVLLARVIKLEYQLWKEKRYARKNPVHAYPWIDAPSHSITFRNFQPMPHAVQTPLGWLSVSHNGDIYRYSFLGTVPTEFPDTLSALQAVHDAGKILGYLPTFRIVPVYSIVPKVGKGVIA